MPRARATGDDSREVTGFARSTCGSSGGARGVVGAEGCRSGVVPPSWLGSRPVRRDELSRAVHLWCPNIEPRDHGITPASGRTLRVGRRAQEPSFGTSTRSLEASTATELANMWCDQQGVDISHAGSAGHTVRSLPPFEPMSWTGWKLLSMASMRRPSGSGLTSLRFLPSSRRAGEGRSAHRRAWPTGD